MKRSLTTMYVIVAMLVLAGTSIMALPSTINYQGKLTTSGGVPLQGTFSVQFTIWDHVTGGAVKWQETQTVTSDADGSFTVLLGSVVPIVEDMFKGCQPSLGIKIGSDPEITPRMRFTIVPYTCLVASIDGAKGGTLWSKLTVGSQNTNTGDWAFVTGVYNVASASYTTIPGGAFNYATSDGATVGGGTQDSAGGRYSVVSGGTTNKALDYVSVVSGGQTNIAGGLASVVAGGLVNNASQQYAVVGGGNYNTASDSAAIVSGGANNLASGACSTVPGGAYNTASGSYSYAAGRHAVAQYAGSFTWADTTNAVFASSAANQFSVRASGGTRIYSNASLTAGVTLAPGASAWVSVSDSTVKRNIRPVDGQEILNKLDQLPVSQWSYKAQDPGIEHIGPMAQDFYALFHVGENNTTISTIDPSGIALAAVKELNKKVKEIDALKAEVQELKAAVAKLTADRGARIGGN